MNRGISLESVLKRDRAVVFAGIFAICVLAWGYMAYEARAMYQAGVCKCMGMKMSGPDTQPWSASALLPLFLMWAEMMVAMMLPSAAPMILTFAAVNRKRREEERPFVPTAIFVLAYLAVWTVFSALAAVAQWVLHSTTLLSPTMVSNSPFLGATLLIAAGIFQWTPFKNTCLKHCRSPLSFLMTGWREGKFGGFAMGVRHGAYCAGCCWFLMALLFVAGVMNVLWIAAITILVLIEKAVRAGPAFGRLTGVLLVVWGYWVLLKAVA